MVINLQKENKGIKASDIYRNGDGIWKHLIFIKKTSYLGDKVAQYNLAKMELVLDQAIYWYFKKAQKNFQKL